MNMEDSNRVEKRAWKQKSVLKGVYHHEFGQGESLEGRSPDLDGGEESYCGSKAPPFLSHIFLAYDLVFSPRFFPGYTHGQKLRRSGRVFQ